MRNLLIVSTSTVYGKGYLAYCEEAIKEFFKDCQEILFIPYARPSGISHEEYSAKASEKFDALGFKMRGIHEFDNPVEAVKNAQGIFTGGGNTFVLLDQLYKNNLIAPIREKVANGMPYMGTSAGSNITGLSISTTNDMPIVYPPSFEALSLVPFNLNPHYLDPSPDSTHMGETRETRIQEFHGFNKQAVIGLREGSWLHVVGDSMTLEGPHTARIFRQGQEAVEWKTKEEMSSLL